MAYRRKFRSSGRRKFVKKGFARRRGKRYGRNYKMSRGGIRL